MTGSSYIFMDVYVMVIIKSHSINFIIDAI